MNAQESKKLENQILGILKKYISKKDTLVAGISGGPDSIFLLHILAKLNKEIQTKIIAAHINHMLRKESTEDENFVKTSIEDLKNGNFIFQCKKSDIKTLSTKQKKGIEETGREIRYKFFEYLAKKYKASFVLTAHHADDNLETIILNFARGAGIGGLIGMEEKDEFTDKFQILRPLLNLSKDKIISYLKFNHIKFRVDKSNTDEIYKRNLIRKKILPELKKLNPNISETVAKNSKNLREINDFLNKEAQKWIKKNKSTTILDAKSFRTLALPVKKIIIFDIHKTLIGNTKDIETKHIEEVLEMINKKIGNKEKKFGKLLFSIKGGTIKVSVAKTNKKVQY